MIDPTSNYMFKAKSRNTRKMYVCSKLTVKASEWKRRSGVFIVNLEHIPHLFQTFFFFADFEQVNISWVSSMTQRYI